MNAASPRAAPAAHPLGSKVPLYAGAALALITLCAVAAVRIGDAGPATAHEADAPVTAARALRFDDQPDGSLRVTDAANQRVVETIAGEAGFVRGTLRGLARERRRAGIGPEVPFELAAHADGRLTLLDPATGRRIDLESFGSTNAAAFARLLPAAAAPARAQ